MERDELIRRAEDWLRRLRPSDTGANGPFYTRLLLDELKAVRPEGLRIKTLEGAVRTAREAMRGKDMEHIWMNYPDLPEQTLGAFLDAALEPQKD